MNERDSETIAGLLEQMGHTQAAVHEEADILVVNTCSVRENADNRFFGLLGRLKHIKLGRPDAIVAVCGCMMQQERITDQIKEKHSWVDLIFGTHNIDELPDMIDAVMAGRAVASGAAAGRAAASGAAGRAAGGASELGGSMASNGAKPANTVGGSGRRPQAHEPVAFVLPERISIVEGLPARREFPFKASVNIMYGCDNFCSYCIVPYTRGREVSRDAGSILAEIQGLAEAGTKEILLLGQNVNSYAGADVRGGADADVATYAYAGADAGFGDGGGRGVDFSDLISMIDEVPGIERVRFMTSHPKDLSSKLIDRFRPAGEGGAKSLCPSIHLPVQAGSSRVLERMNRHYTKEGYIALVASLRTARPDIAITTDFIVGFPGETDEDFEDTMDLIEKVRFDAAFTFLYSPRKGTPAAEYENTISAEVLSRRFDRMVQRLNEITLEKNYSYIGSVQDVLVEGPSKTDAAMLSGRTPGNKLVNFPVPGAVAGFGAAGEANTVDNVGEASTVGEAGAGLVGKIVPVRIVSVKTFSFTGEMLYRSI